MRTIDLKGPVGDTTIAQVIQRVGESNFNKAFTYLATWAFLHKDAQESGGHVIMTVCHDNEITALYQREQGSPGGMLMVAVWRHAQHEYTFHT